MKSTTDFLALGRYAEVACSFGGSGTAGFSHQGRCDSRHDCAKAALNLFVCACLCVRLEVECFLIVSCLLYLQSNFTTVVPKVVDGNGATEGDKNDDKGGDKNDDKQDDGNNEKDGSTTKGTRDVGGNEEGSGGTSSQVCAYM